MKNIELEFMILKNISKSPVLKVKYNHPLLFTNYGFVIKCEENESELDFYNRMLKLVHNKERLNKLIEVHSEQKLNNNIIEEESK